MFLYPKNRGSDGFFFTRAFASLGLMISLLARCVGQEILLKPRDHAGATLRVKTAVEVAGSLKAKSQADDTATGIPVKVDAEMIYDELGVANAGLVSLRHYWKAEAALDVNKSEQQRALRTDRNLILLSAGSASSDRITSPRGALLRSELELLDVPATVFPPERLLPTKPVSKDETWSHNDEVLAELLRLQSVTSNEVTSAVTEVTDAVAKIKLSGKLQGKVDGVSTKIQLVGNYHFDRRNKIVSWIAIAIKEDREVGFAAPGFQVTTRVRSVRQALAQSKALPKSILTGITISPSDGDRLLDFVSDDNVFRMMLDRRWHALSGLDTSTRFRMVEGGDLLATCKIDQLTRSVPGKQITLDGFSRDVQQALGKNCQQVVSAGQTVNPNGIRVMRVEAAGSVGATPIRWIYYHLSDDTGQRLSYIFTLEASQLDRFAGMDEVMTASVEFLTDVERQARASKALQK